MNFGTNGCSQVSVLGSLLWNVVMDTFLCPDLPEDFRLFSYEFDATYSSFSRKLKKFFSREIATFSIPVFQKHSAYILF